MSFQPAALDVKGESLFAQPVPLVRYSEQRVMSNDKKTVMKYIGQWGWEKQDSTLGEWMRHELQQLPYVSFAAYHTGEETERKLKIECHTFAPMKPREAFHMALQKLHKQMMHLEANFRKTAARAVAAGAPVNKSLHG